MVIRDRKAFLGGWGRRGRVRMWDGMEYRVLGRNRGGVEGQVV